MASLFTLLCPISNSLLSSQLILKTLFFVMSMLKTRCTHEYDVLVYSNSRDREWEVEVASGYRIHFT